MEHEFTYVGDATVALPADTADEAAMFNYVYQRKNPRGRHFEWWQHSSGCRALLCVERDTYTHEIHSVVTAEEARAKQEEGAQ